jgi:glycosyltransferase involved in cell wall biosynthesis
MSTASTAGAAPRRIGIVLSGRHLGSRERLFLAVAEALAARGWQVELLAAGPEPALQGAAGPALRVVDIGPAWLRALPLPRLLRLALAVVPLARWIDAQRPALLFATSIPPNLVSLLAARLARERVPVVIRQSNTIRIPGHPRYDGLRRRYRDPLIPRLYPDAVAVIAVAHEVADNLAALGAVDAERVEVIHNAVAIESAAELARAAPSHPWLEARDPREPHDEKLLLSVGRLVRKKDQRGLLDAFALVREKLPARLVVFGEGPMRRALETRIGELGLGDAVALPGHTDNPFAEIARADLFVLSSISEGMPSALIEALACGTPVVSTDCPSGPREILDAGRYGELVEVGDAEALAAAMLRQLEGDRRGQALVDRAHDFAFDRVVPRYVELLERCAGGGAAGG